ncbi:MAG: hypothetical protein J6U01_11240 [Clostridia bacterium]|nr:hypothetical protein [Clostridia bacterium]
MKRKIALGPGAASLILIVVALSLAMMAMLTIIGSRNDYSLCYRSASMIEKVYELNAASEQRLAELDGIVASALGEENEELFLKKIQGSLPKDMTLEDDLVSWSEPLENRTLECTVRIRKTNDTNRIQWVSHKLKVNEPEEDWEW